MQPKTKPLMWQMRTWFLIDTVLVLIAGIQLYLLTGQTDRFFAWTIGSGLTAAFLGAAYWASVPLVFYASRQQVWARARMAIPGVFVFTTMTLVTTLMHLERFNQNSPHASARLVTWVWLLVYVSVPIWLIVITALQSRVPGGDPARLAPLPGWLRGLLAGQAAVMLVLGLVLFIAPTTPLWPWALTPLTGRAVASWLLGIGIIAGQMAWENDWLRVRGAAVGFAFLGILQLLALVRYSAEVEWGSLKAILYVVFLLLILGVGVYGWVVTAKGAEERVGSLQAGM